MSAKWRLGLLAGTALGASIACLASAVADDKIEKVVVTAQKRSEDVQKVPISMKALTGNQLDERGVDGFSSLQTQLPR
jgi:iron complex outermembrane receptor protein